MRLNFEKLEITDIKGQIMNILDAREQMANLVYQSGNGIADLELARKIYNSKGEDEYDERESSIIDRIVNERCVPMFIDAYNRMKNESNKE